MERAVNENLENAAQNRRLVTPQCPPPATEVPDGMGVQWRLPQGWIAPKEGRHRAASRTTQDQGVVAQTNPWGAKTARTPLPV